MAAESASRRIGLIIVGDEILSGRRQDKHFSKIVELLGARGMQLGWAEFLPDDRDTLVAAYRRSFATGDVVFSCGGIGGTPDDHHRPAAAPDLEPPRATHPAATDAMRFQYRRRARQ
ncbi:competence/damage-inducible protein A, partial [Achromobacter ruhlandii]